MSERLTEQQERTLRCVRELVTEHGGGTHTSWVKSDVPKEVSRQNVAMPPRSTAPAHEQKTDNETKGYLHRVECLARFLIGAEYNAGTLWDFQIDLLKLQRDIQQSIGIEKERIRRSKDKATKLKSLQYARWSSRRLGDAFAWLSLGVDSKAIRPLGENDPVPIGKEDHGSRGLIGISSYLAGEGWGFPVIHDVTDCLRIGDVTFVRSEQGKRTLRTVEMKTRYLGKGEGENSSHYDVSVTFLSSEDDPKIDFSTEINEESAETNLGEGPALFSASASREDRRISRQTKRMAKALSRQEAKDGTVQTVDGQKTITTIVDSAPTSHWKTLRRVIRNARRDGYASESVDKAFLYVAYYDSSEIEVEAIQNPQFLVDLTSSGLAKSKVDSRNSLEIASVPELESRGPQQYLPYFLYSIPKKAIFDLLHGRLIVIICTNVGHIADALENHGFDVRIPQGEGPPIRSMQISSRITHGGVDYYFETNALGRHVTECIYEFKGIDYLLQIAQKMKESTIPAILSHSRDEQRES
ncbi:hypothetical protein ACFVXC_25185 [Streptomyces sp. NPDC058257]|uniref:hypothetical protein n=1 Tax=Streptomyces sp. NPDC058257 TaxID=3346409 RepID=UPI0036E98E72